LIEQAILLGVKKGSSSFTLCDTITLQKNCNCIISSTGYGPRNRAQIDNVSIITLTDNVARECAIMSENRFSITKLNNGNYQVWKHKVELLLIRDDLWHTVNESRPVNPDERWLKADRQARATIGLLVEDDQLRHVKDVKSAHEAWEALKNYHQKASLTNQVYLFKRLCSMKLTEEGDMEIHINLMLNIVDELAALGEVLKDKLIIAMLLSSLPESYSTLVTALETRAEDELTLQLVKGKLIDESKRRKDLKLQEDFEDKALKVSRKQSTQ